MNPPSGSRYLKDCRLTTLLQDSLLDERDHSAIEATHRRLRKPGKIHHNPPPLRHHSAPHQSNLNLLVDKILGWIHNHMHQMAEHLCGLQCSHTIHSPHCRIDQQGTCSVYFQREDHTSNRCLSLDNLYCKFLSRWAHSEQSNLLVGILFQKSRRLRLGLESKVRLPIGSSVHQCGNNSQPWRGYSIQLHPAWYVPLAEHPCCSSLQTKHRSSVG